MTSSQTCRRDPKSQVLEVDKLGLETLLTYSFVTLEEVALPHCLSAFQKCTLKTIRMGFTLGCWQPSWTGTAMVSPSYSDLFSSQISRCDVHRWNQQRCEGLQARPAFINTRLAHHRTVPKCTTYQVPKQSSTDPIQLKWLPVSHPTTTD